MLTSTALCVCGSETQQVGVQLPTYADNVALPTFAFSNLLISPAHQTHNSKPAALGWLLWAQTGTDRWTDTISFHHIISVHYASSASNTHTRLTALFPGLPRSAGTRKVKPIWILLKQETVSGSGISWDICKSASHSRQITTPAPHRSVFYRPDALPAAQPTASKHWRHIVWADNTGNDSLKTHGSSLRPLYLLSWLGAVGFHWSKIINSPHALGWRAFMMTCLHWILGYMRLEIWCKIGLSADWCLCTALRTRSGACYYWIECPCQQQLLTRNGELTAKTFSTVAYTVSILLDDKHFQLWIWPNIS